jgi:hypothetical protein
MGLLLTLLYVALSHLCVTDMFPKLGALRIMLWLAFAALLASVPSVVNGKFPFRAPQVSLMFGLFAAIPLSCLAHFWFGGALSALELFLPAGVVFFLVVANVTTLPRLRLLIIVFVGTCLFLLCRSVAAYYAGDPASDLLLQQAVGWNPAIGDYAGTLTRIRALGLLSDPNDFAQCLLTALPFLGLAWRSGRHVRNFIFVLAPASFVLYGVYLTHSRGAVVGLGTIFLLVFLKRLGKTRSIIVAVVLVALLMSPFGGARDTSLNEGGAGRLVLWGTGISFLISSPIYGIGYRHFEESSDLTAHNSYVLCFSELGLIGYFFWLGLIVFTVTDLNRVIHALQESGEGNERLRYGKVLRASLFAFLVTAWFLSRTYTVTIYLILGMAVAFIRMPQEEPLESPDPTYSQWKLTMAVELGSVVLVYAFVKLRLLS